MIDAFRIGCVSVCLLVASCAYEAPPEFTGSLTLGGQEVPAATLNLGQEAYSFYCQSCHGRNGDGRGPAAVGLMTPPRDFRTAMFKFAGVVSGDQLPHDEDLISIVHEGLDGTAMLPWSVTDEQLNATIQYIKVFSPEGEGWRDPDMELATRVVAGADPWEGNEREGAQRGKAVYHSSGTCIKCHQAYATKVEINKFRMAEKLKGSYEARPKQWLPAVQKSSYSRPSDDNTACDVEDENEPCGKDNICRYGICETMVRKLPPDFTSNKIRRGAEPKDIYRTITSGVFGTAMPSWEESIAEKDRWALAHYISQLSKRDTSLAVKERQRIKADFSQ